VDPRFSVLTQFSEYINYNDTVFIRISFDKGKFSESDPPTILLGWRTIDEIEDGGDNSIF